MSSQKEKEEKKVYKAFLTKAKDTSSFSKLTFLLSLVTTINTEESLLTSFHPRAIGAARADQSDFTILDCIAAILVQEHEVVAVCFTSDNVSVVAAETSIPGFPATDVVVPHDVESDDSEHYTHPPQFAALCNPDYSTNSDDCKGDLHNIRIESIGENLWARVQGNSNGWYCAFM